MQLVHINNKNLVKTARSIKVGECEPIERFLEMLQKEIAK